MHDGYEARDSQDAGWRDTGLRRGTLPSEDTRPGYPPLAPPVPPPERTPPAYEEPDSPGVTAQAFGQPGQSVSEDPASAFGQPAPPRPESDDPTSGFGLPGPQAPAESSNAPEREAADVERAVPALAQLRASGEWAWSRVRRSIPLRTVLFLLPPLALPPLAFDLSATAAVVVALILLWLAAAAGVFSMMMIEGSDQVTQNSIERRLDRSAPDDDTMQEALATISRQLDAFDERIASLEPSKDPSIDESPLDDLTATLSHRPQEHWPNASSEDQYDLYGQPAVADTHFAEPGSAKRMSEPPAQDWSSRDGDGSEARILWRRQR